MTPLVSTAGRPTDVFAVSRGEARNLSGWVNVVIAAVIMLATLPGRTQGLGLITEPLLADLGLDRITFAHVNLWATLLGAIICLPFGRLLDLAGLRWTTAAVTLLLGLVAWRMSVLSGGVAALFLLVLATRALGQSALSVSSLTVVGKSFDRGVGVAMGVYSVLLSVLFAAAFVYIGAVVLERGWRVAWAQVAFALVAIVAPLVLLGLREPTTNGRRGPAGSVERNVPAGHEASDGLTLGEALRTRAFWVFAGATSLFGLVSSGLGLFNEAVLAERGFPAETFHTFLAATSVIALVGQLLCGWLSVRWPLPRLLALAMAIYAAALFALPLVRTLPQLWVFAGLMGLSAGMITVVFFAVWRAFGSRHLGRIQGAAQMLTVIASAVGPLIFATCAGWTGSYAPALLTLAPCVLLVGVLALRVTLPTMTASTLRGQ